MSDPERPSLEKPERWARTRRLLRSPVLLAAAGLIVVVSSAFLIGYYDVINQTKPTVITEKAPTETEPVAPGAEGSNQSPAITNTDVAATPDDIRPRKKTPKSLSALAKLCSPASANRSRRRTNSKLEVARQTNRQEGSREKDPILTAMLKTTWRVLKKPFRF